MIVLMENVWLPLTMKHTIHNVEFKLRSVTVNSTGHDPSNARPCDVHSTNKLDNLSQTTWDTFEADRGCLLMCLIKTISMSVTFYVLAKAFAKAHPSAGHGFLVLVHARTSCDLTAANAYSPADFALQDFQ